MTDKRVEKAVKDIKRQFTAQINDIRLKEIILDLLSEVEEKPNYTKEEMEMLTDAVASHMNCKKCSRSVKDFEQKSFDLLQKVGNGVQPDTNIEESEIKTGAIKVKDTTEWQQKQLYPEKADTNIEDWEKELIMKNLDKWMDKELCRLLTDEKVNEYIRDYRYALDWQSGRKYEAVMNIKEYLWKGIKEVVQSLLDKAQPFSKEELEEIGDWGRAVAEELNGFSLKEDYLERDIPERKQNRLLLEKIKLLTERK